MLHDVVERDEIFPPIEPAPVNQVESVVKFVPIRLIQQIKVLSYSLGFENSLAYCFLDFSIFFSRRLLLALLFVVFFPFVLGLTLSDHFFTDLLEVVSLLSGELKLDLGWRT
jgi:hypothetical protein